MFISTAPPKAAQTLSKTLDSIDITDAIGAGADHYFKRNALLESAAT